MDHGNNATGGSPQDRDEALAMKVLKTKRQDSEFQVLFEKWRKTRRGLIGWLRGLEEVLVSHGKFFFPCWVVKYEFEAKKGLIIKKTVSREVWAILSGDDGMPLTKSKVKSGPQRQDLPGKLSEAEFEEHKVADVRCCPPIPCESALDNLRLHVEEVLGQVEALQDHISHLEEEMAPDVEVYDLLRSRIGLIRRRIEELVKERQARSVADAARGTFRSLRHGQVDWGSFKSSIRHGLWSGTSGGGGMLEEFINENLHPQDIEAMDEEELREVLREMEETARDFHNERIEPYESQIAEKRQEIEALLGTLRVGLNVPDSCANVPDEFAKVYLLGYPLWYAKYQGQKRKGEMTSREVFVDGVSGRVCDSIPEEAIDYAHMTFPGSS